MNLVTQPAGSTQCGQCCVAMLAGITREQSLKAFGSKCATTLYAVRHALKRLGFVAGEKLTAFQKNEAKLPETCLLCLTYPKGLGHWVVYYEGQVYDPAGRIYPFEVLKHGGAKSITYLSIA